MRIGKGKRQRQWPLSISHDLKPPSFNNESGWQDFSLFIMLWQNVTQKRTICYELNKAASKANLCLNIYENIRFIQSGWLKQRQETQKPGQSPENCQSCCINVWRYVQILIEEYFQSRNANLPIYKACCEFWKVSNFFIINIIKGKCLLKSKGM